MTTTQHDEAPLNFLLHGPQVHYQTSIARDFSAALRNVSAMKIPDVKVVVVHVPSGDRLTIALHEVRWDAGVLDLIAYTTHETARRRPALASIEQIWAERIVEHAAVAA